MGLVGRIGTVISNSLIITPVFVLLLVTAIMTAIGAAKLNELTGTEKAHKWVTMSTIVLWVLFGGGLTFMFTIGLFLIPWVVTFPYLFGGVLSMFGLVNLSLAGVLFYGANAARTSPEYKKGDINAKSAFNNLLICGILMAIAALLMFAYSVYTIFKYHQSGGLTGDIALAGNYGGTIAMALGQPEIGVPLKAAGGMAQKSLSSGQQKELQKRGTEFGQYHKLAGHVSTATGKSGGGATSLLSNPEFVQGALNMARKN